MRTPLADGLYAVVTPVNWPKPFVAGLIVEDGEVQEAAPILRRKLAYWLNSPYLRGPIEKS